MSEMSNTPGSPAPSSAGTHEVAAEEAKQVAGEAKAKGQQVAGTAKEGAQEAIGEARSQVSEVLGQARQELTDQAATQHQRAAGGLRSLADELADMSTRSGSEGPSGLAADLARQGSAKVREVAEWLESREPGDVLDEVKRFARQRPGTFLLGAAAIGFLGGRLTRGLADDARQDSDAESSTPRLDHFPDSGVTGTDVTAPTDASATMSMPSPVPAQSPAIPQSPVEPDGPVTPSAPQIGLSGEPPR